MTRAFAAKAQVRPGAGRSSAGWAALPSNAFACLRSFSSGPGAVYFVPAAAAIFLLALALMTAQHLRAERRHAFEEAARVLQLRATLLAARLDAATVASPGAAPSDLLRDVLPEGAETLEGVAAVADEGGAIVAHAPAELPQGATLAEMLGVGDPLTILAEKAGVMRVRDASGEDLLATVRNLQAPLGQLAYTLRVGDLLAPWRQSALVTILLLGSTVVVLSGAALAYLTQLKRARAAAIEAAIARGHVDLALNRGRCGLWDWDLERGAIVWSKSMFELLDYAPSAEAMAVEDLQGLIHPDDADLVAFARQAIATG